MKIFLLIFLFITLNKNCFSQISSEIGIGIGIEQDELYQTISFSPKYDFIENISIGNSLQVFIGDSLTGYFIGTYLGYNKNPIIAIQYSFGTQNQQLIGLFIEYNIYNTIGINFNISKEYKTKKELFTLSTFFNIF